MLLLLQGTGEAVVVVVTVVIRDLTARLRSTELTAADRSTELTSRDRTTDLTAEDR